LPEGELFLSPRSAARENRLIWPGKKCQTLTNVRPADGNYSWYRDWAAGNRTNLPQTLHREASRRYDET
jgi:hypothetical protein